MEADVCDRDGEMNLVYLCPEALLELLLDLAHSPSAVEHVEMSQHPHHLWEPVHLKDVKELKGLHLKPKASIHEQ